MKQISLFLFISGFLVSFQQYEKQETTLYSSLISDVAFSLENEMGIRLKEAIEIA